MKWKENATILFADAIFKFIILWNLASKCEYESILLFVFFPKQCKNIKNQLCGKFFSHSMSPRTKDRIAYSCNALDWDFFVSLQSNSFVYVLHISFLYNFPLFITWGKWLRIMIRNVDFFSSSLFHFEPFIVFEWTLRTRM